MKGGRLSGIMNNKNDARAQWAEAMTNADRLSIRKTLKLAPKKTPTKKISMGSHKEDL